MAIRECKGLLRPYLVSPLTASVLAKPSVNVTSKRPILLPHLSQTEGLSSSQSR